MGPTPPFRLRRKPFRVLCCFFFQFVFFILHKNNGDIKSVQTAVRRGGRESGELLGGRGLGEEREKKKHRDLTYCLPLSNDSVFKRPYGDGGGGGGGCATRHLKINDERSNQTSIRPCPGQIFGGSIGTGLYFIFVSTHGRHLPVVTTVV